MKRKLLFIGIICLTFLIGFNNVKATITYPAPSCSEVKKDASGNYYETCTINFSIKDVEHKWGKIEFTLRLDNVTLDQKSIKINSKDWYLSSTKSDGFIVETTKTVLPIGDYNIATFNVYKINANAECGVYLKLPEGTSVNRACTIFQDVYYDKDGNITNQLTYQKDCLDNTCKILSDGTRYGKDGTVVDELTYQKQCGKNICTQLSDGTYYGKDGKETDKVTYEKDCTENICKILDDGTIYGPEGTVVDKITYQKECEKHTCEILSDGTTYGKNGSIVDKITYQKECQKNICKILDDGTYYGKDGKTTDKATYEKDCVIKETYCATVDDKYYNKDGKEITKLEYQKECEKHTCEIVGDSYFDKNGKIVTKAEYEKICENKVENPKTGSIIPMVTMICLTIAAVGIIAYSKHTKKLY